MDDIIDGIEKLIDKDNIENEEIKALINNIRNIDILSIQDYHNISYAFMLSLSKQFKSGILSRNIIIKLLHDKILAYNNKLTNPKPLLTAEGYTPLHFAVLNCVKFQKCAPLPYIINGSTYGNLNIMNKVDGNTALMIALIVDIEPDDDNKRLEAVKIILEKIDNLTDLTIRNDIKGWNVIDIARNIMERDRERETETESEKTYDLIFKKVFSLLIPILESLVKNKDTALVKKEINVLNKDINLEKFDYLYEKLIYDDKIDILTLLFDNGIDPKNLTYIGVPVIYYAVANQKFKSVKLLLERGVDLPNIAYSMFNYTINFEIFKLLLDYGVNPNNTYINDKNEVIISYFIKNYKEPIKFIEVLLKYGANPNNKDEDGLLPLSYAVDIGKKAIIKVLLKYGADLNIKDEKGMLPLSYALDNKNTDIIKLLINNGANPYLLDTERLKKFDEFRKEKLLTSKREKLQRAIDDDYRLQNKLESLKEKLDEEASKRPDMTGLTSIQRYIKFAEEKREKEGDPIFNIDYGIKRDKRRKSKSRSKRSKSKSKRRKSSRSKRRKSKNKK